MGLILNANKKVADQPSCISAQSDHPILVHYRDSYVHLESLSVFSISQLVSEVAYDGYCLTFRKFPFLMTRLILKLVQK